MVLVSALSQHPDLNSATDTPVQQPCRGLWCHDTHVTDEQRPKISYTHVQAGMELRLLHTVAHRQTWYGRWGFLFGRGGFATGKQVYTCLIC